MTFVIDDETTLIDDETMLIDIDTEKAVVVVVVVSQVMILQNRVTTIEAPNSIIIARDRMTAVRRIAIKVPVDIMMMIEEDIEAEVGMKGVAITITLEVVGVVMTAPTVVVTLKNKICSNP